METQYGNGVERPTTNNESYRQGTTAAIWAWLLVLGYVFFCPTADAETGTATAELSWEHPTERVNGEPLPLDALSGYELEIQAPDRSETLELGVSTEYTDTAVYPYGEVVVTYRVRVVDTFGLKGEWSSPAEYQTTVKPEAAPAAPVLRAKDGSAGSSVP